MNIGFIGFGKMGSAIADGIVNAKLYKNENIFVYDISSFAKDIAKQKGFNICNTLQEVFDVCNTVLLAIKPQELSNAIKEIIKPHFAVVSISLIASSSINFAALSLMELAGLKYSNFAKIIAFPLFNLLIFTKGVLPMSSVMFS